MVPLELPLELWSRICDYVVVQESIIGFGPHSSMMQPAITRVNRALRDKALPVYYQRNEFVFIYGKGFLLAFQGVDWSYWS